MRGYTFQLRLIVFGALLGLVVALLAVREEKTTPVPTSNSSSIEVKQGEGISPSQQAKSGDASVLGASPIGPSQGDQSSQNLQSAGGGINQIVGDKEIQVDKE